MDACTETFATVVNSWHRWTEAASDEGLHGLGQSVINDAMDEWHKRLWACVHIKGRHLSI